MIKSHIEEGVRSQESGERKNESENYLGIFRHFLSALNGSRKCDRCITGFSIRSQKIWVDEDSQFTYQICTV
ncbi:hypothetical protein [Okeania sp. SIO2C2]|uniref:hypothetical protein n=1 Tax=Okeania sp. SIO2C2 TaxID=2607787 RepID=UPI00257E137A|nr:hypothetical protein [Okeania sp. SIO2C2]